MSHTTLSPTKNLIAHILELVQPLHQPKVKVLRIARLKIYWQVGKSIAKVKIKATDQVYFRQLATAISAALPKDYSSYQLKQMLLFYQRFPRWKMIYPELSWSHYRCLMRLSNREERKFYLEAAARQHWNVAVLQRQLKAQYYQRSRGEYSQKSKLAAVEQVVKDFYLLEFLELTKQQKYLEKDLEEKLIEQLQYFLMELGDGFSFVARQKRLITATGKQFYVDLVFYHFRLRCFVLIELKKTPLSHRDIGQLDMYVRMFDEKIKTAKDEPTIGIILCPTKDPSIVKYSALNDNPQLYAAQYGLIMNNE
ncbi:MAG: PDDEXK nuclease domain-containing protein [Bacteroidota bacterium]